MQIVCDGLPYFGVRCGWRALLVLQCLAAALWFGPIWSDLFTRFIIIRSAEFAYNSTSAQPLPERRPSNVQAFAAAASPTLTVKYSSSALSASPPPSLPAVLVSTSQLPALPQHPVPSNAPESSFHSSTQVPQEFNDSRPQVRAPLTPSLPIHQSHSSFQVPSDGPQPSSMRVPSIQGTSRPVQTDATRRKIFRGRIVRVWLHQANARATYASFFYLPVIESFREGFEELGAIVSTINTQAKFSEVAARSDIARALTKSHIVVLISVGWMWGSNQTNSFMKEAAQMGAFLVLYQTEFLEAVATHWEYTLQAPAALGAAELWDFSLKHIDMYEKARVNFTFRFMPPGYAKTLDQNVSLFNGSRSHEMIGFLGYMSRARKEVVLPVKDSINGSNSKFTLAGVKAFVESYPLQLNLHQKGRRPSNAHQRNWSMAEHGIESVRLSLLLSNQACVLSEGSHWADEKQYSGIVHFFNDSFELSRLLTMRRDVRQCQQKTYAEFKRRFHAKKILLNSGFLDHFIGRL